MKTLRAAVVVAGVALGLAAQAASQSDVLSLLEPGSPPATPPDAQAHDPWAGTVWEGYCTEKVCRTCGAWGCGWWFHIFDSQSCRWPCCGAPYPVACQQCNAAGPVSTDRVPTKAVPDNRLPPNRVPANADRPKSEEVLPLPPVPSEPAPPRNVIPKVPRELPKDMLPRASAQEVLPDPGIVSLRAVEVVPAPVCSRDDYLRLTQHALSAPENHGFMGCGTSVRFSWSVR